MMTPPSTCAACASASATPTVLDGARPAVSARHGVRPARPERRGQDHAHQHPVDPRAARIRERPRRRARRRRGPAGGARAPSASPASPPPSTGAHRRGEPADDGPAVRALGADAARARARAARALRPRRRRAASASARYSGGMRRRLDLALSLVVDRRPCCSSTSRRPVSTPAAGRRCGTSSARCAAHGTTVFLTTQYLEEADQLADRIAVLDHGRHRRRGHRRPSSRRASAARSSSSATRTMRCSASSRPTAASPDSRRALDDARRDAAARRLAVTVRQAAASTTSSSPSPAATRPPERRHDAPNSGSEVTDHDHDHPAGAAARDRRVQPPSTRRS